MNFMYTAIPRDTLPLDMLTPQIRHYELRQKNSRYANFSDLSTPSYAIFQFFQKNSRYANFSDLSTPSYAIFDQSKNFRYANFSAVFTPNYAIVSCVKKFRYHISSYTFCGNYFFLHLEIQRSQYISPKVTVHKGAETIQRRKLFKGGNYMRKYGILILVHTA